MKYFNILLFFCMAFNANLFSKTDYGISASYSYAENNDLRTYHVRKLFLNLTDSIKVPSVYFFANVNDSLIFEIGYSDLGTFRGFGFSSDNDPFGENELVGFVLTPFYSNETIDEFYFTFKKRFSVSKKLTIDIGGSICNYDSKAVIYFREFKSNDWSWGAVTSLNYHFSKKHSVSLFSRLINPPERKLFLFGASYNYTFN